MKYHVTVRQVYNQTMEIEAASSSEAEALVMEGEGEEIGFVRSYGIPEEIVAVNEA